MSNYYQTVASENPQISDEHNVALITARELEVNTLTQMQQRVLFVHLVAAMADNGNSFSDLIDGLGFAFELMGAPTPATL